jgi:hypothetical protein
VPLHAPWAAGQPSQFVDASCTVMFLNSSRQHPCSANITLHSSVQLLSWSAWPCVTADTEQPLPAMCKLPAGGSTALEGKGLGVKDHSMPYEAATMAVLGWHDNIEALFTLSYAHRPRAQ